MWFFHSNFCCTWARAPNYSGLGEEEAVLQFCRPTSSLATYPLSAELFGSEIFTCLEFSKRLELARQKSLAIAKQNWLLSSLSFDQPFWITQLAKLISLMLFPNHTIIWHRNLYIHRKFVILVKNCGVWMCHYLSFMFVLTSKQLNFSSWEMV